ncbi:MAG: hypothetical protein Q9202_007474 [Teloschistes flavicans]
MYLGAHLQNGRYKILHKLGFGGWSTVWAARDKIDQRYVAIKIVVAELHERNRELQVMRALGTMTLEDSPGMHHLSHLTDQFQVEGPNGTHDCLVFPILGTNLPDLIEARYRDERLPGHVAKMIAHQALLALDCLHQREITHGDLHTRNLVLNIPAIDSLTEEQFLRQLKDPECGAVISLDGEPLDPGLPEYLVWPSHFSTDRASDSYSIRLVDFGESFQRSDIPPTLRTPLVVRAPEVLFGDQLNHCVDLWSMGCMLFELITGQPPFSNVMVTPPSLVGEMLDSLRSDLPERWQEPWRHMRDSAAKAVELGQNSPLQEWLEEVYFNAQKDQSLSRNDIEAAGNLIRRFIQFEPSERISAREALEDPWFEDVRTAIPQGVLIAK